MTQFTLEEIITQDNFVHQGIFAQPAQRQGKKALLWVHGLTGKFYGDVPLMNMLADTCIASGLGFASFNTRGHDMIANISTVDANDPSGFGHKTIGAGYEKFEECIFDTEAAVAFLVRQGFPEVIIAGHSSGANKVAHFAAQKYDDSRIAGVVLAGPMSDRLLMQHNKEEYEKNITMLKMLRDEGKGDALLTKASWFPATADRIWSLIAPNTPEDVFNYGDSEHTLSVVSDIRTPLLVIFSGNDEHADRPVADIKQIFDAHTASENYRSIIIPGTTHGYEGKEKEFVSEVVTWAASL